jgi:hypothetical protein
LKKNKKQQSSKTWNPQKKEEKIKRKERKEKFR